MAAKSQSEKVIAALGAFAGEAQRLADTSTRVDVHANRLDHIDLNETAIWTAVHADALRVDDHEKRLSHKENSSPGGIEFNDTVLEREARRRKLPGFVVFQGRLVALAKKSPKLAKRLGLESRRPAT